MFVVAGGLHEGSFDYSVTGSSGRALGHLHMVRRNESKITSLTNTNSSITPSSSVEIASAFLYYLTLKQFCDTAVGSK